MSELIATIFGTDGFEPHIVHFLEDGESWLVWLNVTANALIALAYLCIPPALWYFVSKRKDLQYKWIFKSFAIFIMSCGLTHVMHIVIYWYPAYRLETLLSWLTALSSVAVAVALWYLVPFALKLPTPTQLAEAEREIRKKEEELVMRREIERRRDAFLNTASHELRTPLTSQRIMIDTLQRMAQSRNDDAYGARLRKLSQQTDRLSLLAQNLLDVIRIEDGKIAYAREPIDLDACLRSAVDDIAALNQSHEFIVEGSVGKRVYGDCERLSQVFVNILVNAVKYSPGAKKIVIRISQKNEHAEIRVQDFGIGIDPEHHERLFERFYRVDGKSEKTFPGMGIGLFISREIIKNHGGKLWVESRKGEGSTFIFTLPFEAPGGQGTEPALNPAG